MNRIGLNVNAITESSSSLIFLSKVQPDEPCSLSFCHSRYFFA